MARRLALLLLSFGLEEVKQAVSAAYEVWVVSVDVRILDLNEVGNHIGGRSEALHKNAFHDVTDLGLESVVSLKLRNLNRNDDLPQLFVHLIGAIKRWLQ